LLVSWACRALKGGTGTESDGWAMAAAVVASGLVAAKHQGMEVEMGPAGPVLLKRKAVVGTETGGGAQQILRQWMDERRANPVWWCVVGAIGASTLHGCTA